MNGVPVAEAPAAPPSVQPPKHSAPEPGRIDKALSWLIRGSRPAASHALLLPMTTWLSLCLLVPIALLMALSLTQRGPFGALQWHTFTLENFRRCLHPQYLPVLARTLAYAGSTTLACLLLGYPFAYFVVFFVEKRRTLLLILLMLPFWTSYLVNLYAWMILLGREGLLNNLLLSLHWIKEPIQVLNTPFAVVLGQTHCYLPFMILPIYGALEKMPRNYIEASKDLGAGPVRTFLKVTFPLSLHGVLAGSILTFIPVLGDFLAAEFLGGPDTYLAGNLIQNQFLTAQDWPFGAALSVLLLMFLGVGLYFYQGLGEPDEAAVRTPA